MTLSVIQVLWCLMIFQICWNQELELHEALPETENQGQSEEPELLLAVSGGRMSLPCDIESTMANDEVYLVLWYKDEIATPIYSLDARRGHLGQARHASSDTFIGRAYFSFVSKPAVLEIDQVSTDDEGVYRCRVDFQKARTRHSAILVRVVVPPGVPIIKDYNGEVLTGVIGPYNEGDSLHLICQTEGGKPVPNLTWWMGSKMVDDTFEVTTPGSIRNELTISQLQRKDLMSILTCQASNNDISPPVETSVTLDMNFRPQTVTIKGKRRPFSAKKPIQFECEARGSRPPAMITWRKGSAKLRSLEDKISSQGNVTRSVLSLTPASDDNGKTLSCQADNIIIPGSAIEDRWKLEVHYVPQLTLRLGSKLRHSNILEGNDVYFECNIRATPWVSETGWKFEDQELHTNLSAGVIVSNQSLVLQKVQRVNRGRYSCTGSNPEGQGESNTVYLRVQYSPVCKSDQESTYGAMLHYPVQISCEVEADPDDITFRWEFNSSSGSLELIPTYTSGTRSTVNYIPRSEMDFGTLFCWGRNSVGLQRNPCVFVVIPAEPPSAVHNCTISDETEKSFHITCMEGRDGGLNQYFFTEVRDLSSNVLQQNVSALTAEFTARSLIPGSTYMVTVYASNAKGRSLPTVIRARTLAIPESQTRKEDEWDININPILLILSGVVGGLLLVALLVLFVIKIRIVKRKRKDSSTSLGAEKSVQGSEKCNDSCSEGCTCSTRDEEKIRENIPDVLVFSEKVKPGSEETMTSFPPESVYWNRIETTTIGPRGDEYLSPQVKMKFPGSKGTWSSPEWSAPPTIPESTTLQFHRADDVEQKRKNLRHVLPPSLPPTLEDGNSTNTQLVTARQTDV